MRNASTVLLKSTSLTNPSEGFGGFIRPTPSERLMGRLMRAPDGHDGGEGGGDGGDAGASAGDAGAQGGDQGADGGADGSDNDGSLMGGLGGADDGDGSGGDEGKSGDGDGGDAGADGDKGNDATGQGEGGEGDEGDGLPEAYTITLPEGYEQLDESLLAEADPIFRELGLGQEQVDKLVPFVPKIQQAVQKQFVDRHEALGQSWAKASKGAPDLGGDKWKDTEAHVAKAFDLAAARLPDAPQLDNAGKPVVDGSGKPVMLTGKEQIAEFKALLDGTKLGNHPTMLRVFNFFGRGISEDSDFIRADGGAQVKRPREEVRYPHDAKQGGN